MSDSSIPHPDGSTLKQLQVGDLHAVISWHVTLVLMLVRSSSSWQCSGMPHMLTLDDCGVWLIAAQVHNRLCDQLGSNLNEACMQVGR